MEDSKTIVSVHVCASRPYTHYAQERCVNKMTLDIMMPSKMAMHVYGYVTFITWLSTLLPQTSH